MEISFKFVGQNLHPKVGESGKEAIGISVELPDGATLGEALAMVKEKVGRLPSGFERGMYSVNGRAITQKTMLKDGDVVSALQRLGGG